MIPDDTLDAADLTPHMQAIRCWIQRLCANILLNPTGKPLIHKGRKP